MNRLHSVHHITFKKKPVLFVWSWDIKLLFHLSFRGKLEEERRQLHMPFGTLTPGYFVKLSQEPWALKVAYPLEFL